MKNNIVKPGLPKMGVRSYSYNYRLPKVCIRYLKKRARKKCFTRKKTLGNIHIVFIFIDKLVLYLT